MKWLSLLISILSASVATAKDNGGVKMQLSLGMPYLTITNPDETKANYDGLAASARGFIPIFYGDKFRTDLTGSFRYLDFENKANGSSQSEYASYLGPGAGLELTVYNIYVGASYFYYKGRHTSVGTISHKAEFQISGMSQYIGIRFEFGLGALGLSYSQMSAKVPGSAVGLSSSSDWDQSTLWLQFTYNFKTTTGKFLQSLFGK
ncbi:MAG: hypothetical protein AB7F86_10350 [Bdellovibrionales bacterium]